MKLDKATLLSVAHTLQVHNSFDLVLVVAHLEKLIASFSRILRFMYLHTGF